MSQSREIITALEADVAAHPEKIQFYKNTLPSLMKQSQRVRFFDTFPNLLPRPDVINLGKKLRTIIRGIKGVNKHDDGIDLVSIFDVLAIKQLIQDIAKLGCIELFNYSGDINKELVDFFGWNIELDTEAKLDLLQAYISVIFSTTLTVLKGLERHVEVTSALQNCINAHYREWAREVLNQFITQKCLNVWCEQRVTLFQDKKTKPHVFENGKHLLAQTDIDTLRQAFNEEFRYTMQLRNSLDVNGSYFYDKDYLKTFIKNLTRLSCKRLLDEQGKLKPIASLSGMSLTKDNICEVIIDHVNALIEDLFSKCPVNTKDEQFVLQQNKSVISKHYYTWAAEVLHEQNLTNNKDTLLKILGIGAVLTLGLVGAAIAGGIYLFSNYPKTREDESKKAVAYKR